jgi:thymidylate synthase (FAD)
MKAELVNHMGSDLTVVNAARVSFNKESEWEECVNRHMDLGLEMSGFSLMDIDVKLINYLAKHGHFTPFTHPQITLRETVPIFVARQRFKHVVGFTYNEVSRRYVDEEPEFYTPDVWRSRPEGSVKQGSGEAIHHQFLVNLEYNNLLGRCMDQYKGFLKLGMAPEQARMVLPQSMHTSYYVTGSLAAFARMCKQRLDPHAQQEIQGLAKQVDSVIRPLFPVSWAALMGE